MAARLQTLYEVAQMAVAISLDPHSVNSDAAVVLYPAEVRAEFLARVHDDEVLDELLWREVHSYG